MKKDPRKFKPIHCKTCGHGHIPKTGPCMKTGCGCHALDEPVVIKKKKKGKS